MLVNTLGSFWLGLCPPRHSPSEKHFFKARSSLSLPEGVFIVWRGTIVSLAVSYSMQWHSSFPLPAVFLRDTLLGIPLRGIFAWPAQYRWSQRAPGSARTWAWSASRTLAARFPATTWCASSPPPPPEFRPSRRPSLAQSPWRTPWASR